MPNSAANIVPDRYFVELKLPVFELPIKYGSRNHDVKRIQEWLVLHGADIKIDSDYGPATAMAVASFKNKANVGNPQDRKGEFVDKPTWDSLTLPLQRAMFLAPGQKDSFSEAVCRVARGYLAEHPREVGGDNKGVWQRHFARGRENQPWCQDFASTVWFDAARAIQITTLPFALCDAGGLPSSYVPWVADQARLAGMLVYGHRPHSTIPAGSMFFVRGHGGVPYSHVGIVTQDKGDTFLTIEGNTNDEGSANGYEVCQRERATKSCDFGLSV
jgi:hypothetical protein